MAPLHLLLPHDLKNGDNEFVKGALRTFGLARLSQIKVEDFNFIADPSKTRMQGFIAQDLYKVYPEAVTIGGKDAKKKP